MTATFRTDDQDSNAYARYPVKSIQQISYFDNSNWIVPKVIAQGTTTVVGSKISKILISTDDALDNQILFYLHDGTSLSSLPFSFETIPALSGSGLDLNKLTVNPLRSINFEPFVDVDNNGNTFLMLSVNHSVWAKASVSIQAGKTIQIISWLDDY